jgi:hypothetical protein
MDNAYVVRFFGRGNTEPTIEKIVFADTPGEAIEYAREMTQIENLDIDTRLFCSHECSRIWRT